MPSTKVDLYRNGNASGPRMTHIRTNLSHPVNFDVEAEIDPSGAIWVKVNSGGLSTWELPTPTWDKVWKLPAHSNFPTSLKVWNDAPGHWSWDPASKMSLHDFRMALSIVEGLFTRIK